MREIKFRAWDTEEKRMIEHNSQELVLIPCIDNYGADAHFKHKEWGDIDISHFDWASADLIGRRYILMQFTGLKDKNGTEIYEGDIVSVKKRGKCETIGHFHKNKICNVFRRKVFWDESAAMFVYLCPCGHSYKRMDSREIFEIIGNIHQNPELLKE